MKQPTIHLAHGETMICPFCDDPYNHIHGVATVNNPEGDENVSFIEGTNHRIERASGASRSSLEIEFTCELCGTWFMLLQQHKGCTEVAFRHSDQK